MTEENPLKQSIQKRLEEERYIIPREKEERTSPVIQLVIALSILVSLIVTIIWLIRYFIR